jgi:DNA-binding SARP family transcriptional activator
LFWPRETDSDAARSLSQTLFDLRDALGDQAFVAGDSEMVGLDRAIVYCDTVEFEELCRVGELPDAMQLYRGLFLHGIEIEEPREAAQWLATIRARLQAKASSACTSLSMDVVDRDARAALDWSRRAYEIEPSEGALRRLMVLHHALGDSSGAIRHYDTFARDLKAEHGIEPSAETRRLLVDIRAEEAARKSSAYARSASQLLGDSSSSSRFSPVRVAGAAIGIVVLVVGALLIANAGRSPAGAASLTSSRAARDAYRRGELALHGGRFEGAVNEFKRAVELDSTYAIAWYRLSESANWTGQSGLAGESADRARRLAAALPSRDRSRIDAWTLYLAGQATEAQRVYSGMLAADSTDVDAWFYLAEIQFHWGPMFGTPTVRSAAAWDRVLELDPVNAGALIHRLRIAALEFDRDRFESLASRLRRLAPSPDRELEVRGIRAFAFGDSATQIAAANDVAALDVLKKTLIREMLVSARDVRTAAARLTPKLFVRQGFSSWEQGDLMLVAQAQAATGQLDRALVTLDSAALLQPDRALEYKAMLASIEDLPFPLAARRSIRNQLDSKPSASARYSSAAPLRHYLAATLDVRLGNLASARQQLALLRSTRIGNTATADSTLPRHVARLSRIVAAEIARAEGKLLEARTALGEPVLEPDMRIPYVWSYPRAHERFLRGQLAAYLGRDGRAEMWFDTFPDPGAYDLPYWPWALRRRADLAEKSGEPALADSLRRRAQELFPTR